MDTFSWLRRKSKNQKENGQVLLAKEKLVLVQSDCR